MYGADATENDAYVKMINQKHFDRVTGLIDPEKVVFGGGWNERTMQIQPTILDDAGRNLWADFPDSACGQHGGGRGIYP